MAIKDITKWLDTHNLGQYKQSFIDSDITLDLLTELDQNDLKEIGLTLGDRKRFLIAVREIEQGNSALDSDPSLAADNSSASITGEVHLSTSDSIDGETGASNTFVSTRTSTINTAGSANSHSTSTNSHSTNTSTGAERRQLTVMFVDLVGSTALSTQLDPEDMGLVVRQYQSLAGRCISDHGGYVSRYMGDGILAYFGWPLASEDDATHAVSAALAITTAISELKTPDGKPLCCRCGIATGLVVVGELIGEGPSKEHAVVGETPNLAARLQGLAAVNSAVVSMATRRLVGDHFEFHSLGLQELKGIRDPVPVFSVVGARSVESRFHASRGKVALPMVGRQRQLEQLRFFWHQSITGHASRVLLQGEAGIGKSRLLQAFIDSLESSAFARVILQCDPLRTDSSLYPATQYIVRLAGITATDSQSVRLEKLRSITAHLPTVEVTDLSAEVLPLLAALLGLDVASSDADLSQYTAEQLKTLTLHALACVMCFTLATGSTAMAAAKTTTGPSAGSSGCSDSKSGSTSDSTSNRTSISAASGASHAAPAAKAMSSTHAISSAPVLLVLEDAHWIDPTTIELLGVLSQLATPRTVMILITGRPEFDPTPLPFNDLNIIQLPRLGADACRHVVSSVSGGMQLPDSVLDEIVEKTDGVPLFAEELTKTVMESNALKSFATGAADNQAFRGLEIPSSLHDSLMSRLDRFQSPREVAQTAACIGREFSYELLRSISPVAESGLRQSLQKLVDADLIFSDSESHYSFKHALVRDTAYESLLKSRRQQIHLQIAQSLKENFPMLLSAQPELAGYHFRHGAAYIEASDYWHRAAKLALQRVANREAIAHAGSGLDCLQRDDHGSEYAARKYDLLFARGMGFMAVNGYAAETVSSNFSAALHIASELADNERFSQAARGVVTAHIVSSRFDAGLALADTMLDRAETRMQRFYALRMQGQIYLWQARFEDSRKCFEQAIELYDADYQSPLSQWDDGVLCVGFLGITLTCLGQTDLAESKHQQSVQMANKLNQPFSQCQAMESWITSILLRGDDFTEQLKTFTQLANTHKMIFFQACAQMYQGIQQIRTGDLESAPVSTPESGIAVLTEGLKLYRACQSKLGVPKWMTYVAEGHQYANQHDVTLQLLDQARLEMDDMGNEYFRAEWSRVRAVSLAASGSPEQADALFNQALSLSQAQGARLFELTAIIGLVQLQHRLGREATDVRHLSAAIERFNGQQSFTYLQAARDLVDQVEGVVSSC